MGKTLAVIAGPTASGKSDVSIALAHIISGEVISADSIQVYRHMDIGSAKLTEDMMQGIPHHMLDILEPYEDYNVSLFTDKARIIAEEIRQRGHLPIVCGGTGFYIQALLYGIDFPEGETDPAVRERLVREAKDCGTEVMEERLKAIDPVSAGLYHGNTKRIIRALEYHELTGELLSDKNAREREKEPVYDAACFVLTMPREMLYERIDRRVDMMMEKGLVDEVRQLKSLGVTRDMTSMQGLGYRQIYDHLNGVYDLDTAVAEIKKQTRHFAKRQLTWFRRERDVIWVDVTEYRDTEAVAEYMAGYING
ncbi:MAG: tRNA (adenosine(37)-N6)-dimethylallyltransferase MiaA [Lachnospiraceae bacterium]|nr:tRNA (adenosine(37)-N6)-dimethylallyltransferase MiaA [Lachnospiraceae bacterium]